MTEQARRKAAALNLDLLERWGWKMLVRQGDGRMVARGDTWDQCFARLDPPAEMRKPSARPSEPGLFDGMED